MSGPLPARCAPGRQLDHKPRSMSRRLVAHGARAILHQPSRDRQPEPGERSAGLGGDERLEQPVPDLRGRAGAVVFNDERHCSSVLGHPAAETDRPAAPLDDGLMRVDDEVEQRVRKLVLPAAHRREGPHRRLGRIEAHAGVIAGVEGCDLLDYARQRDRAGLSRAGSGSQSLIKELKALIEPGRRGVERITEGRVGRRIGLVQQIPHK